MYCCFFRCCCLSLQYRASSLSRNVTRVRTFPCVCPFRHWSVLNTRRRQRQLRHTHLLHLLIFIHPNFRLQLPLLLLTTTFQCFYKRLVALNKNSQIWSLTGIVSTTKFTTIYLLVNNICKLRQQLLRYEKLTCFASSSMFVAHHILLDTLFAQSSSIYPLVILLRWSLFKPNTWVGGVYSSVYTPTLTVYTLTHHSEYLSLTLTISLYFSYSYLATEHLTLPLV